MNARWNRLILQFRLRLAFARYRIGYWWLRFMWNRYLFPLAHRYERIILYAISEGLANVNDFTGFGYKTTEDRYDYDREER